MTTSSPAHLSSEVCPGTTNHAVYQNRETRTGSGHTDTFGTLPPCAMQKASSPARLLLSPHLLPEVALQGQEPERGDRM